MNPTFIEAPPADECTENMNFETERQLLKQERQKKSVQIMTRCESEPLAKNPIKVISPASLISPSSDLVSSVDTLNKLIQLYCAFWDCNMIVNPMSELYFVIYLITMQYVENTKPNHEPLQITQSTDDNSSIANGIEKVADLLLEDDLGCSNLADSNEDEHSEELKKGCCSIKLKQSKTLGLFGSPHNCVYFACSVLEYQKDLLTNLDKPTLKLLAENHRIASFKPELSRFLNENYNFKSNQIQQMKQLSNAKYEYICISIFITNHGVSYFLINCIHIVGWTKAMYAFRWILIMLKTFHPRNRFEYFTSNETRFTKFFKTGRNIMPHQLGISLQRWVPEYKKCYPCTMT